MNGYMKIERNANDMCHVASWAMYPIGVYEISLSTTAQKNNGNKFYSVLDYSFLIIFKLFYELFEI